MNKILQMQNNLNTLIIDDNDTAINYCISDIDNNNNIAKPELFNDCIQKIIKCSTMPEIIDAYKIIKDLYQFNKIYKVKRTRKDYFDTNLLILNKIIRNIKHAYLSDDFSFDWIDCPGICLILDNGQEIQLNQYENTQNVKFIKFLPSKSNGYKDTIISTNFNADSTKFTGYVINNDKITINQHSINKFFSEQNADADYDGYEFLENLLNYYKLQITDYKKIINEFENISVIKNALRHSININGDTYIGYLPAYGQLKFIFNNLQLIRFIIDYVGGRTNFDNWNNFSELCFWTSTMRDIWTSFAITLGNIDLPISALTNCRNSCILLPLFKKL